MYNTYSSYSSTVAFRTTYFGFNDYYTCFSPNYRCPSNYYCHCCCSFTVNSSKLMLPMNINPNLLYGLKQSTLIQCPPSRRVFLGSCDGYCSRSSIYDVGRCRCCCGEACCVKKGGSCNEKGLRKSVGVDRIRGERDFRCNALEERKSGGVDRVLGRKSEGVDRIRGRVIRNERDFRCTALGERKSGSVDRVLGRKSAGVDKIRVRVIRGERDFCCNALDDAEAMLSLLSEKGIDECVVVRDTRKRTSKDTRVVRDENVATEKWNDVRGNSFSGSGYLESKSKKEELSSGRDHFREEGHTRKEERKSNVVDEDMGLRRRESGSSYYSVLESGEFESDSEVDFEEERFVGESSTRQEKDLRKVGGVVISEVTDDVLESSKDEKDQRLVSNRCDDVRVGSSTEWDWRKKSEKKLSDESSEVIKSRNESILRQSKLSQVDEKSSIIASSSKKQFSNIEEESTLGISSQRQSRSRTRKDDSLSEYSKSSGWNEQSISSQLTEQMSNRVSEQHLVSGSQHEQSTSGASLSGRLKSRIETDNQASEYLISSQQHEESSLTNRTNVESPSTSTRRPIQGNGPMVVVGQSVQETGCDYCITCGRSVQESKIESNIERESRRGKQEVGASSSHTLVVEENKKSDRLNVEQYSESLDYDYGYDRSTLRIQKQPQMRKKKFEDTLTSVKSPSDAEILQVGLGDRVVKETESRKVLQIGTSDSQVHSTSGEISRHSASDRRKYDEQTYSTSKLTSIEELVEKHTTRLITDVQEYVLQVGLTGNVSGEINTSQLTLGATSQAGAQQVNEVERTSDLQLSVTSPTFQSIEGKSSDSELENSIFRTSTGSEVDGYGGYSQPQATRLSSFDETNQSGIRFAEESSLVDAISSVERMHESSSQIVHEFVEKTRHDSSVSETKLEKESSNDSLLGEAGLVKRDSGLVSESSGTKGLSDNMWDAKDHSVDEVSESESELREAEISKNDVARRTGRSLWNIVDGLFRLRWRSVSETQKSPVKSNQQRSSYDSASAETWFSGNEHDEGMKREQITLSQEPTSSDQPSSMITPSRSRHGDRKKKQSISVPPETTSELPVAKESASKSRKKDRRKKEETALDQSLHRKTTNKSQKGDARLTSLDDRLGPVELHVSSSASAAQGGLVSGSVSIGAKTDLEITQQTSHPSPISPFVPSFGRLRRSGALKENEQFEKIEEQTISTGEQRDSIPSARQLARLDAFEETEEAERNQERISSTIELKGHSVEVRKSSVPTSEEIDTEIKRKKLQRSNQVISDRYDEWEDAYRLENEQRKVDEIFMREALAEAMKAADSWEVPVGAVLVQNGKVIARGYNLVEELRDSTAHAEMICIREASNVLKTWRLSETTLYVTLEPCPMCAGAILQARIGTFVWGAPNKLLGADGSWIRLFPEGVEGEERSEVADKPTPPVHPFHPKMKIRGGVLESEFAHIMPTVLPA